MLAKAVVSIALAALLVDAAEAQKQAAGLTRDGHLIEASYLPATTAKLPAVILIGGLDGDAESSQVVLAETQAYERIPRRRRRFQLLSVPLANPGRAKLNFPPQGVAYRDETESHYLWRWIGMQAPDLVIVTGEDDADLANALTSNMVAGYGKIPARRVRAEAGILRTIGDIQHSEARRELESRLSRTPRQVADELAVHYGHELPEAVYIPAVALIGRLRLGYQADIQRIVEPFLSGAKDSLAKPSGSHLSGHLIFAELAERTGDKKYIDLVRRAANLGFTESGEMKESMPLHSEMSDAVFMSCPILAKAGKLTGERKYFDMSQRHFEFMSKLCLRSDGLYRHSPLDEAAWGRGNGFPALGLALTLSDMPKQHPAFDRMLDALRKHLAALSKFQDESGMWRQVIDKPGAYREFSATAMIGIAMLRAVRNGWVDARSYQPRINSAWRAILARTRDGRVMDVCEGTGKQKSLQDYLNRAAILDRDPRGGAMALLFATEMAGLK